MELEVEFSQNINVPRLVFDNTTGQSKVEFDTERLTRSESFQFDLKTGIVNLKQINAVAFVFNQTLIHDDQALDDQV